MTDNIGWERETTIPCEVAGCVRDAVNTCNEYRHATKAGQAFTKTLTRHRCQEHTSRFDVVVLGPGPTHEEANRGLFDSAPFPRPRPLPGDEHRNAG